MFLQEDSPSSSPVLCNGLCRSSSCSKMETKLLDGRDCSMETQRLGGLLGRREGGIRRDELGQNTGAISACSSNHV